MCRGKGTAIACLVIFTTWITAPAQKVNDAMDLLKKVRETYGSLKSFQFEGVSTTESRSTGMQIKTEFPFEGDFVAPTKIRIETKNPRMGVLVVSDGDTAWVYLPSIRTYSKLDVGGLLKSAPGGQSGEVPDVFRGFSAAAGVPFDMFQLDLAHGVKEAKILGEEDVELGGKKVACYVVQAEYALSKEEAQVLPPFKSYWIDKARYVVLRESFQYHVKSAKFAAPAELKHTSTLTKVRLNEPVPDNLFVFTPPEGARQGRPPQIQPHAPDSP